MRQLYLPLFALFVAGLSGCLEEPDMNTGLQNALPPEFDAFTQADISITATSIRAKATVKKENGDPVVERGFIYWPEGSTDVREEKDSSFKDGKGSYELTMSDLVNDTIYHISPFARNEKGGIGYGDTLDVRTNTGIGSVVTSEVKEYTATTAVLKGTIRVKGEGEITNVGFRFYTSAGTDSTVYVNKEDMPTDSTFVYTLTNLTPETEYTVEAVVENSFGRFNTNKQSFTTPDGHPVLDQFTLDKVDYTYVTVKARLADRGEGMPDSVGFCWGTVKDAGRPNIVEDSVIKCTVDEEGYFSDTISLLKPGIQYSVRGFAANKFGPVYTEPRIDFYVKNDVPTISMSEASSYTMEDGTVTVSGALASDGRTEVKEIVVYCSLTDTPGPDNETDLRDTILREDLIDGKRFEVPFVLKGEKTYYVKAYATNDNGTGESNIVSFETPKIISTSGNLATFTGDGRINYAFFTLKEQAFVVGGDVGSSKTNELYGYNPTYNEWKSFDPYPIKAMNMAVCAKGDTAYLFGGNTNSLTTGITDCYSYTDNEWTALTPLSGGNIRSKAVCFPYEDRIYLIGGNTNNIPTDTICYYNLTDSTWNNYGKFETPVTDGIALVSDSGEVFVGLGEKIPGRGLWKAADGKFDIWTDLSELPDNMGNVSSGVIYGRNIYVIDDYGVIWQYDIDGDEWHQRYAYSKGCKNYELFMLNETIYILSLDYYQKTLVTYDPTWDN